MDCPFDQLLAKKRGLALQICLSSADNCLHPVELATLPYAVAAGFAAQSKLAERAALVGSAAFAHRITADRGLMLADSLGVGYFDGYTPAQAPFDAAGAQDGYLQWTPRDQDRAVHVSGQIGDLPVPLARLALHADSTETTGSFKAGTLLVAGDAGLSALTVKSFTKLGDLSVRAPVTVGSAASPRNVKVYGDVKIAGDIVTANAGGDFATPADLDVEQDLRVDGALSVGGTAAAPLFLVTNAGAQWKGTTFQVRATGQAAALAVVPGKLKAKHLQASGPISVAAVSSGDTQTAVTLGDSLGVVAQSVSATSLWVQPKDLPLRLSAKPSLTQFNTALVHIDGDLSVTDGLGGVNVMDVWSGDTSFTFDTEVAGAMSVTGALRVGSLGLSSDQSAVQFSQDTEVWGKLTGTSVKIAGASVFGGAGTVEYPGMLNGGAEMHVGLEVRTNDGAPLLTTTLAGTAISTALTVQGALEVTELVGAGLSCQQKLNGMAVPASSSGSVKATCGSGESATGGGTNWYDAVNELCSFNQTKTYVNKPETHATTRPIYTSPAYESSGFNGTNETLCLEARVVCCRLDS
jgi:hypothetical protein